MSVFLNIANIKTCTLAEGPGKRFAIWVQGCNRRCAGCCNKEMQELKEKYIVDVKDIITLIEKSKNENNIEGITLLGGEPILQAEGLKEIASWCKNTNLSVMLFSGFLYSELVNMNNRHIDELLKYTDILVDGEFIIEEYDEKRNWIGSKNQKIYFLTNFYKQGIELENIEHSIDISISSNTIAINGWPCI